VLVVPVDTAVALTVPSEAAAGIGARRRRPASNADRAIAADLAPRAAPRALFAQHADRAA
jgi:hypothetical protein